MTLLMSCILWMESLLLTSQVGLSSFFCVYFLLLLFTHSFFFLTGKGSFYATDLEAILQAQKITTLLVMGVTTEVCVHTTIREANDRGYHCIAVSDACASFFDDFHEAALRMITAQGGIFGSVADAESVVAALSAAG